MNRLYYYNRQSRPIYLVNNKAVNYSKGGLVEYKLEHLQYVNKDNYNEDTIYSLLEEGSLVVPRPIVDKGYIDEYIKQGGKISNGKEIKSKKKLIKTIIMPGEIIVQAPYTNNVLDFLKKKGITLPIDDRDFY